MDTFFFPRVHCKVQYHQTTAIGVPDPSASEHYQYPRFRSRNDHGIYARNPTLRICVDHVELDAEQRGTLDEGRFQLRPMLLLGCDLTQLFIAIVYIHI